MSPDAVLHLWSLRGAQAVSYACTHCGRRRWAYLGSGPHPFFGFVSTFFCRDCGRTRLRLGWARPQPSP